VLAGLGGDHSVKEVCREHAISETLYSLPQEFSRDPQLVGLASERPLQLGDLAPQLPLAGALLLADRRARTDAAPTTRRR
jgi:hypothetical protein